MRTVVRMGGLRAYFCSNLGGTLVQPSIEDEAITRRLKEAGELLMVPLLDHVLFSETAYVSFHEHGILA